MIEYRKIDIEEKENVIKLINQVLDNLERKDFFIPFNEQELEDIFNEEKTISYGAYEDDKIVGMAQLYLEQSTISEIKEILNLNSDRVVELGGYLVLLEHRNKGIIKQLEKMLIQKAKELNYEYVVITVHPENIASNKATEYTGAKVARVAKLGEYLRNIYVLNIKD